MKTLKLAAIAIILLCGTACGGDDAAFTDPSKPVVVLPCTDFVINLESNRTTGFGWDLAEPVDERVVKFVSCEYLASGSGLAGSGGREVWNFRSACPGKAAIAFKYIRPWEKASAPARKMTFNVIVRAPAE